MNTLCTHCECITVLSQSRFETLSGCQIIHSYCIPTITMHNVSTLFNSWHSFTHCGYIKNHRGKSVCHRVTTLRWKVWLLHQIFRISLWLHKVLHRRFTPQGTVRPLFFFSFSISLQKNRLVTGVDFVWMFLHALTSLVGHIHQVSRCLRQCQLHHTCTFLPHLTLYSFHEVSCHANDPWIDTFPIIGWLNTDLG